MHGPIVTVCILIDKAWNEIRSDRNDKGLGEKENLYHVSPANICSVLSSHFSNAEEEDQKALQRRGFVAGRPSEPVRLLGTISSPE